MSNKEQVVARFIDGRVLKGYVRQFSADSDIVSISEAGRDQEHQVPLADLKALFFIKSFEGDSKHRDKKVFGISGHKGQKVYVKFIDRESLMGYIEGAIPWDKGFFLANSGDNAKGFFMKPVDNDGNNVKVFVVGTSVEDVTVMIK
jgi:hypothetical protein